MSRIGDHELIKQKAEALGTLLTSDQHPQSISDKVTAALQQLPPTQHEKIINYRNTRQNGRTAVHLAASKGLWQSLEVLLKNGGEANAQSSHKDLRQTPLHFAAREGNGKCIEVLLENGADYKLENDRKETALKLATAKPCRDQLENTIARLEVPQRSKTEEDIVQRLHRFIENQEEHQFFQLYTNQPREKVDLSSRWYDKCLYSEAGGIADDGGTIWYDSPPQPSKTETLLHRGCMSNTESIVQFMLSKSPNQPLPNLKTGETPLHAAVQNSNMNLVAKLLDHSPKLVLGQTSTGISALYLACLSGHVRIVELILEQMLKIVRGMRHVYNDDYPFSLDLCDSEDITPLYLACLHGFPKVVQKLLWFKAAHINLFSLTVHAVTKKGYTALHAAASSGNNEVVDQLLASGEVSPEKLAPPLTSSVNILWSAIGGSQFEASDTRKIFVSGTGDFVANTEGLMKGDRPLRLTALAEACIHGHGNVIDVFLEHGIRDDEGLACRLLSKLDHHNLCQKVLSYHCKVSSELRGSMELGDPSELWKLHLLWGGKKLPVLKGEWFKKGSAVFTPDIQKVEYDDGKKRAQSQRRKTRGVSMAIPLPRNIDHIFVRSITLRGNCLKEVPLQLFKLPNVTFIDLSQNQLTSLPFSENAPGACGWECAKLQDIKLSDNKLTQLPYSVWVSQELRSIHADHNELERLGTPNMPTIYLSKNLEKLDVSYNLLEEVDELLVEIGSLKTVCLCHNRLSMLPLKIWDMPKLVELKASNNRITCLTPPPDAGAEETDTNGSGIYTELRESTPAMTGAMRINTARAHVCPQISRHPSLHPQRSMDVDAHLSMTPLDHADGPTVQVTNDVSKLKKLDLSSNHFNEVPREFPCVTPSLEELNISQNPRITHVELHFLPASLRKLNARNCCIERFGNILNKEQLTLIKKSCMRKELRMTACEHRNHDRLLNLTSLNLKENRLSHFQVLSHTLPSKGAPNFAAEEKTYVEDNFSLLYPSLENLDLSSNHLQGKFNPNVGHFGKIMAIQLRGNEHLQVIPYELGQLKRLKNFSELDLSELPELVQPPKEVVKDSMCQPILTYLAAGLKQSEPYRTIKLFLVGKTDGGKSTLLRRLTSQNDKMPGKTVGIDIEEFNYPPKRKGKIEPVQFIVWDFAGEDQYHTTHHCFYSQRSLYVVVYNMKHEEKGLDELGPWLRNIKLRAQGCPVVIVGTHMDKLKDKRVMELEETAKEKYVKSSTNSAYPHVVEVVSVSCVKRALKDDNIDKLKRTLYDISTHLHVTRDGHTLKYDPAMAEDSHKALLMQQVPKSFLTLQQMCLEHAQNCREGAEPMENQPHPQNGKGVAENGTALPNGTGNMCKDVMNEEEFRDKFGGLFNNDREELDEAVSFLHLQGTLLHFDDHSLKDLYFLDPQLLAKFMAHVVHLQSIQTETKAINGVLPVEELFKDLHICDSLKPKYIQLLEKFEVALSIGASQVLIPSLMSEVGRYPRTGDDLRGITHFSDDFYITVLRRFWLVDFVQEGFWPRLICRIANDQQIVQILKKLIGTVDTDPEKVSLLDWTPWKMGVAFSHRGRTLLVVKEEENQAPESDERYEWLPAKKRLEVHVYAQDWFEVQNELCTKGQPAPLLQNTFSLPGIATQLLMKISQHILSLSKVFRSLLNSKSIYIPCWKCYGDMESEANLGETLEKRKRQSLYFPLTRNGKNIPVYAFHHERCIILAAEGCGLQCPIHGSIKVVHTAPDLIFWDLASLSEYEQDMSSDLRITNSETIGRGGYGFVCQGELLMKGGESKAVAVKGFLSTESAEDTQDCSVEELLEISKEQENLYHAYREIRQEVSFLALMNHANLTRLVGVRTSPYMCLMLELAPHGSLSKALKLYKKYDAVLEPVTLQLSISQIASGMEYLHMKQIIHQDMKSANVLVWKFPSGKLSREKRQEKTSNVWLKLTDYGISQVSTKPTMKLTGNPQGTPGFMAPELFGPEGHEISSVKVDVFAFGMVIYELLSLQGPFASVDVPKRNTLVMDGKRPKIPPKAWWMPLMAQDVMTRCWSADPEKRPTMKKVTEWVVTEEFRRLRAEISIDQVESVSCACVCRVTVDDNKEDEEAAKATMNGIGHVDVESSISSALRLEAGGFGRYADVDPTEYTRLQYEPPSFNSGRNILPPMQHERGRLVSDGSGENFEKERERSSYQRQFSNEAYTQVWVCDKKERGGLLEIFSYCDTQPSYLAFVCKCRDQITAICPVRNMMWIGTTNGILKLKNTSTLNTKFKGELKTEGEQPLSPRNTHVLSIAHVEQTSSVIVSTTMGEIWAFNDKLTENGLMIEEHMILNERANCYQMAVVEVEGSVEVWGTMDNSQLIMLKKQGKGWMMEEPYKVDVKPKGQLFCITHTAFSDKDGSTHNHLWMSYRSKGIIVSWDLQRRQYRATVDTMSFGEIESGIHAQVTTLAASGSKVLVGTEVGTVGVIDSHTCQVLHCLKWHTSKVRSLLLMPQEMEPCVCSELPLPEMRRDDAVAGTKLLARAPTRPVIHRPSIGDADLTSLSDVNPSVIETKEDERMVASIGNGRAEGVIETDPDKKHVTLLLWRC